MPQCSGAKHVSCRLDLTPKATGSGHGTGEQQQAAQPNTSPFLSCVMPHILSTAPCSLYPTLTLAATCLPSSLTPLDEIVRWPVV